MAECSTSELCAHRRAKSTLLHLFIDLFRNLANIQMSEEEFPYETDL